MRLAIPGRIHPPHSVKNTGLKPNGAIVYFFVHFGILYIGIPGVGLFAILGINGGVDKEYVHFTVFLAILHSFWKDIGGVYPIGQGRPGICLGIVGSSWHPAIGRRSSRRVLGGGTGYCQQA